MSSPVVNLRDVPKLSVYTRLLGRLLDQQMPEIAWTLPDRPFSVC